MRKYGNFGSWKNVRRTARTTLSISPLLCLRKYPRIVGVGTPQRLVHCHAKCFEHVHALDTCRDVWKKNINVSRNFDGINQGCMKKGIPHTYLPPPPPPTLIGGSKKMYIFSADIFFLCFSPLNPCVRCTFSLEHMLSVRTCWKHLHVAVCWVDFI